MTMDAFRGGPCRLCGQQVTSPFRFGLGRCDGCGLVFSPAIWRPGVNGQMESDWFDADWNAGDSAWVRRFEQWNIGKTLARLGALNVRAGRLLEIGPGTGSLLVAARRAGFDVQGCDLSPGICRQITATTQIPMHCGPIDTIAEAGRFDVVVLNHVLEHVEHPVEFLRELSRLLKPGGVAHIAVPNVSSWEARLRGWGSYEPYHLSYFTPETLAETVQKAGLVSQRLTTGESFSGWSIAILRTLLGVNRKGGAIERPADAAGEANRPARGAAAEHAYRLALIAVGAVSWPLRWLQARLGAGDEIVALVTRPAAPAASAPQ